MYEENMINANVEGYERQVLILRFFFYAPEDGHVLPTPETIHAILKERHDLKDPSGDEGNGHHPLGSHRGPQWISDDQESQFSIVTHTKVLRWMSKDDSESQTRTTMTGRRGLMLRRQCMLIGGDRKGDPQAKIIMVIMTPTSKTRWFGLKSTPQRVLATTPLIIRVAVPGRDRPEARSKPRRKKAGKARTEEDFTRKKEGCSGQTGRTSEEADEDKRVTKSTQGDIFSPICR
jgi:hypothetical protein